MRLSLFYGPAIAAVLVLPAAAQPTDAGHADTVNGLRQADWQVVKKVERDEWVKGEAPYENLRRLIYTAVYTLEKNGRTRTCTLTRDLMTDKFTERCSAAE